MQIKAIFCGRVPVGIYHMFSTVLSQLLGGAHEIIKMFTCRLSSTLRATVVMSQLHLNPLSTGVLYSTRTGRTFMFPLVAYV